jgi:hypothetical protein
MWSAHYDFTFRHTVFMCFVRVFIWEQTLAPYNINWSGFITDMKSVYCPVRTRCLIKQSRFVLKTNIPEISNHTTYKWTHLGMPFYTWSIKRRSSNISRFCAECKRTVTWRGRRDTHVHSVRGARMRARARTHTHTRQHTTRYFNFFTYSMMYLWLLLTLAFYFEIPLNLTA